MIEKIEGLLCRAFFALDHALERVGVLDKNRSHFTLVSPRRRILLRFDRPDEQALASLRRVLEGMPVSPVRLGQSELASKEPHAYTGCLEEIMGRLTSILKADWERVERFTREEVAAEFEYVVAAEPGPSGAVAIDTRLSCPGREGSVSYGREVRRISVDHYLLRVND